MGMGSPLDRLVPGTGTGGPLEGIVPSMGTEGLLGVVLDTGIGDLLEGIEPSTRTGGMTELDTGLLEIGKGIGPVKKLYSGVQDTKTYMMP